MHENDVPPIKYILSWSLKPIKSSFAFFDGDNICKSNDAHYCDTVKKKTETYQKGQFCKNHENWFYENWLFQEETPFEENKTVMKSKLYFKKIKDVNCIYRCLATI